MSRNFHRQLIVQVAGGGSVTGGGPTDLTVEFSIEMTTFQTPNQAYIRIRNPAKSTVAMFQNKTDSVLTLTGGYRDNSGLLYKGDIKQTIFGKDSAVDTFVDIYCASGDGAYRKGILSASLPKGYTPRDKANLALKAMQPFGVTGFGLVNVDLSKPSYPRGGAFVEMARDLMRQVALSAGGHWSVQNDGLVHIVDIRRPLPSNNAFILNSTTGMVGISEQTENGIKVRSLINPALGLHSIVQIAQSDINAAAKDLSLDSNFGSTGSQNINLATTGLFDPDGRYVVIGMTRKGTTRGEDFYDDLTAISVTSGQPTAAQAASGLEKPYVGTY